MDHDMLNEGSQETWEGLGKTFKGLGKIFLSPFSSGSQPKLRCPECGGVLLHPDPEEKYDFRCKRCYKGYNYSDLANGSSKRFPKCSCGGVLKPDSEGKYDFRCTKCYRGYHSSDLNNGVNSAPRCRCGGVLQSDPEGKYEYRCSRCGNPAGRKIQPAVSPCLFVFAVFYPDNNLKNWCSKHENALSFSEEVKDILLDNDVYVAIAKECDYTRLKAYLSENTDENSDLCMFIVQGELNEFIKNKFDNSEFFHSDLRDLFEKFVQNKSSIKGFSFVNSKIGILSGDSPFDIHFIQP